MKKKSPRGIPDFSRHTPHAKDGRAPEASRASGAKPARAPQPQRTLPRATSSKAGQRGQ